MLKKTCRLQFFEHFGYSNNLLITNILRLNMPFLSSKNLKNSLTFKFLFRHSFKAGNYTFLNILAKSCCLFLRFPLLFYFQRTVLKFSAR